MDNEQPEVTPEEEKAIAAEAFTPWTEEGDSWLYDIQYPFEPTSAKRDPMEGLERIRMEKTVYARHIRETGGAENQADLIFLLVCSLTGKSASVIERLDAEDYGELANKAQELLSKKGKKR